MKTTTLTANTEEYADNYTTEYCLLRTLKTEDLYTFYIISSKK
jgi:hypothetical protein